MPSLATTLEKIGWDLITLLGKETLKGIIILGSDLDLIEMPSF